MVSCWDQRESSAIPASEEIRSCYLTIAGKPSDDLAPGTLNSVLKQAGLKEKE